MNAPVKTGAQVDLDRRAIYANPTPAAKAMRIMSLEVAQRLAIGFVVRLAWVSFEC